MYKASVRIIHELVNQIAPFDTQEDFDNSGLLLGNMEQQVDRVLVALDVTPGVIREASEIGAQLIISHHPLMFSPIRRILSEGFEGSLLYQVIRENISLISAHTNLDKTRLCSAALMLEQIGCKGLEQVGSYVWMAELPEVLTASALGDLVRKRTGAALRIYGEGRRLLRTAAMAGGAYGEGFVEARASGADAYLTGEVRHHQVLEAAESGFVMIDLGHYHSEVGMVPALCGYLQKELNSLQYHVAVSASSVPALSAGYAPKEEE